MAIAMVAARANTTEIARVAVNEMVTGTAMVSAMDMAVEAEMATVTTMGMVMVMVMVLAMATGTGVNVCIWQRNNGK